MTDFEKNKRDGHLANLLRQVREPLQSNNPVQAYICLQNLEKYLYGLRMDGSPWKDNSVTFTEKPKRDKSPTDASE